MKKNFLFLLFFVAVYTFAFSADIKFISVSDIKNSLKDTPPINVGFDVDDTVLFSSPGFYYGKQKYSPKGYSFLKNDEFWTEMNSYLDLYSIPKEIAKKVISMHLKRGDSIYFITARKKTESEQLTRILSKDFNIKNMNKVIFTGYKKGVNLKISPIKENNIKIFYGDSDSDIEAAKSAGIRGIRIMRAPNSTHKPMPKNGSLGEEVLKNSEF